MKLHSFLILVFSLLLLACNPSADAGEEQNVQEKKDLKTGSIYDDEPGHEIVLKTNGFASDTLFLAHYYGEKPFLDDTVLVEGNKAVFAGKEKMTRGIYMFVFPPKNTYLEIIMGYDQHFTVEVDTTNMISSAKVKGSVENEVFFENLQATEALGVELSQLQTQYDSLADKNSAEAKALADEIRGYFKQMNEGRQQIAEDYPDFFYSKVLRLMKEPEIPDNPDPSDSTFAYRYYRAHYFDGMDWSEAGMVNTPVMLGKLTTYMDRIVPQHPDSLAAEATRLIDLARANDTVFQTVTITLLNKYGKSKIMGFDAVYVAIVEATYARGDAFWSDEEQVEKIINRARSLSPTLVGQKAPPVQMADVNGNRVNMYDLPGKYTILYFWDYDCGHCKKVTPKLAELYPKYQGKNVSLMTVSINGSLDVWKEKLKEYGMDKTKGVHVQDHARSTGFDAMYDLRSTPRLFLLDKDKKIMAKQISVDQLEEILDREFEKES
jgi:peroxiredoxin